MRPIDRQRANLATVILLVCGSVPANAEPLNPLAFPSASSVSLTADVYGVNSTTLEMTGPTGVIAHGVVTSDNIAVFCFTSITVPTGATVTLTGRRPVALLATGNIVVNGTIWGAGSSGAYGGNPVGMVPGSGGWGGSAGAGGGAGGNGADGILGTAGRSGDAGYGESGGLGGLAFHLFVSSGTGSGGGGGASAGRGGDGGSRTGIDVGGSAYGDVWSRLTGGSGGAGGGSGITGGAGAGGGGGGAGLELGALGTIDLSNAVIDVSGGGGGQGGGGGGAGAGGGGGGAGGVVLVHGATVLSGGTIDASGGSSGNDAGGGGGGRITIQSVLPPPATNMHVTGGAGAFGNRGQDGAIARLAANVVAPDVDFGAVPVGTTKTMVMTISNTGDTGTQVCGRFPSTSGDIQGVSIYYASSSLEGTTPSGTFDRGFIRTVDGSGTGVSGEGTQSTIPDGTMWLSSGVGYWPGHDDPSPTVIWDLGAVYDVSTLKIWNYNENNGDPAFFTKRGVRSATLYAGLDLQGLAAIGPVTLNQAPGVGTVDFGQVVPVGRTARYVALANMSSFGSDYGFVGLSEVRFQTGASPFVRGGYADFSGLASGQTRAVPYTFTPTTAGPFSQTVTIMTDAGPVPVALRGVGGGASGCRADFNLDNRLNSQDLFDFLTAFFSGC